MVEFLCKCLHLYYIHAIIATTMEETRRQRFKRLANRRVNKVLNQLRVLGNLANKSYYDYNKNDISKMFRVIDAQLKAVKGKFHINPKKFRL